MGIVVEFYSVEPDTVALAGSSGSNPVSLAGAIAAARAAEPQMVDGGDPGNDAQTIQTGSLPPAPQILAELTRHRGNLLASVPVNSLVSEVLWAMFSSAGIDIDPDHETLQAVVLSDVQVQVIAAVQIGDVAVEPVTIAIAEAAVEALSEANWVGGVLVMIVA